MLTNMKKRSALLVTLAVVCATLAVAPGTASAQSKVPNVGSAATGDPHTPPSNESVMTACPMSSAPAAGFSDTTSTDVDCIKMFGITQGTTATTYEPDASIPRWQMALFLHRMFVPTGLAAAGTTTVPAFTDTAGLSTEIQAAITALASHGITLGTTATTFGPDDNVTREQMAMFLYRLGGKIKTHNGLAADATGIFANDSSDIGTGTYQFTDITSASFEGMESIIAMYNIGATGETCTATTIAAAAGGSCQTTYRPSEDITRGEMATMIKEVLDLSNARPAGCTMQNNQALAAGGGAETTVISCRNADFTPQLNTTVDEFWQVRNDTTAATAALSVPFVALSGLVNTGGGGVAGSGTVGTVDAGDRITNSMGNVAGQGCAAAAAATCRHWIHTGDQGTLYIDGASTTSFLWEGSLPATATPGVFATTMTSAIDKAALSATCNFGGAGSALGGAVSVTDGECAFAGTTRTITTTFTGASAAAVVDGYTTKYTDMIVNYGGGSGNQTVTYNVVYAVSSGGVTTYDVVCGADHLPLTNNAAANNGAAPGAEYYEAHTVTVDLGTAAGGTGLPTGAGDITGGNITGNTDVSCDDVPRAYADGQESLSVNTNVATVSTAGTLVTATATAADQYGDGIAGVTVTFDTVTSVNAAVTAEADTNVQRSQLVTNSSGLASYTHVACDSASIGLSGKVAFLVDDAGGNPEVADINASTPGAAAAEGTTVYCVTAGSDTVTATTAKGQVTQVPEVQRISFMLASDGTTACNPKTGQTYIITYDGEAGDAIDGAANNAAIAAALNSNANLTGVTAALAGGGAAGTYVDITFAANTGDHPLLTAAETALINTADDAACMIKGGTETGGASSGPAEVQTAGVYGITYDFIDHDAAADTIVAVRTIQNRTAAGAAVVETRYEQLSYDSTDAFNIPGTSAATIAEFEAALNAVANLTTDFAATYRTGALTTGVSGFTLG